MSERKKSGIYAIVNAQNQKCYVGQAVSIGDRWLYHQSSLRRGVHHNRKMQNAWKKYGADAFSFRVLEYVQADKDMLAIREQFWIDLLDPAYNIAPVAGSTLGIKHPPRSEDFRRRMGDMKRGYKPSPEQIQKQRQHARENPYRHTPEAREKIAARFRGQKLSPAQVERLRQANTGRKQSPEHIAKRVSKLIGHTTSEYTKQRAAEANRARLFGTKQSPELIEKRIAPLRGRKRPDVTAARLGVPRTPEAVAAIRAGQIARWADRAAEIRAAIRANPTVSATQLGKMLHADRNAIAKYKKELQCQQPPQSVSAAAEKSSPPKQADLFT